MLEGTLMLKNFRAYQCSVLWSLICPGTHQMNRHDWRFSAPLLKVQEERYPIGESICYKPRPMWWMAVLSILFSSLSGASHLKAPEPVALYQANYTKGHLLELEHPVYEFEAFRPSQTRVILNIANMDEIRSILSRHRISAVHPDYGTHGMVLPLGLAFIRNSDGKWIPVIEGIYSTGIEVARTLFPVNAFSVDAFADKEIKKQNGLPAFELLPEGIHVIMDTSIQRGRVRQELIGTIVPTQSDVEVVYFVPFAPTLTKNRQHSVDRSTYLELNALKSTSSDIRVRLDNRTMSVTSAKRLGFWVQRSTHSNKMQGTLGLMVQIQGEASTRFQSLQDIRGICSHALGKILDIGDR